MIKKLFEKLLKRDAQIPETPVLDPRVYLTKVRADLVISPSDTARSWVGGLPKMPVDVEWPAVNGTNSLFMAQISLEDLPEGIWGDLGPATGWLLFFWAGGKATVIHTSDLGVERPYPSYEAVTGFIDYNHLTALKALGRTPDGFVPTKWGLKMQLMAADDFDLPTVYEKMQVQDSPMSKLRDTDFTSEIFSSLQYDLQNPPEAYIVSFLAREAYARDPSSLHPTVRELFEEIWGFEATYEILTVGGQISGEYSSVMPNEAIMLMEFPQSQLVGFAVGSSCFAFFISPQDLSAGRFENAWLEVRN